MKRPAGLFLLLLALLLPLQGLALAAACDPAASPRAVEHCAGHPHTPAQGLHHHECGACCCLAMNTAPLATLPASRFVSVAAPARPLLAAHPTLLLDRLDRPPRLTA